MTLSSEWATPLTIGAFVLMTVTGVLMFFHLDTGFNKLAHEWLSWLMVGGVALHAAVNWLAFKRHLLGNRIGQVIVAMAVLLTAASFAPNGNEKRGGNPPMLTLRAVMAASVKDVAPLTGRPLQTVLAELNAAGFAAQPDTRLDDLAQHSRDREATILNIIFPPARPGEPAPAPR